MPRLRSVGSRGLGWLAAGAVAALAVAALVDAVWERGGAQQRPPAEAAAERLRGAGVPAADALAGRLSFVERSGCVLGSLDLSQVSVVRQELPGGCSASVSPDGRFAVVADTGRTSRLLQVGSSVEAIRSLGGVRGAVAWSGASGRVAWCRPDGGTIVLEPASGRTAVRPGCRPRFAADGALLTVVGRAEGRGVYADGELLLGEEDLRSALVRPQSGPVRPLAADRREDGTLAVVVSAAPRDVYDLLEEAGIDPTEVEGVEEARRLLGLGGPFGAMALSASGTLSRTELQLWRGGRLAASRPLRAAAYPFANRRFGELLEFSPGGGELALGFEGTGVPIVLLDVATLDVSLRPTLQHGFAWSPDGAYFALSNGAEVTIAGALRSEPAYVLPLAASDLSWLGTAARA